MNISDEMHATGKNLVEKQDAFRKFTRGDMSAAVGPSPEKDEFHAAAAAFNQEVVKANPGLVSLGADDVKGAPPELVFQDRDRTTAGELNKFLADIAAKMDIPSYNAPRLYTDKNLASVSVR